MGTLKVPLEKEVCLCVCVSEGLLKNKLCCDPIKSLNSMEGEVGMGKVAFTLMSSYKIKVLAGVI